MPQDEATLCAVQQHSPHASRRTPQSQPPPTLAPAVAWASSRSPVQVSMTTTASCNGCQQLVTAASKLQQRPASCNSCSVVDIQRSVSLCNIHNTLCPCATYKKSHRSPPNTTANFPSCCASNQSKAAQQHSHGHSYHPASLKPCNPAQQQHSRHTCCQHPAVLHGLQDLLQGYWQRPHHSPYIDLLQGKLKTRYMRHSCVAWRDNHCRFCCVTSRLPPASYDALVKPQGSKAARRTETPVATYAAASTPEICAWHVDNQSPHNGRNHHSPAGVDDQFHCCWFAPGKGGGDPCCGIPCCCQP